MARMIAKTDPNQPKSEAIKETINVSKHLKWAKIAFISSLVVNVALTIWILTTR